jgi:arginine decarboxylase
MFKSVWQNVPAKIMNITESAIVDADGLWTTVVAAAVFLME